MKITNIKILERKNTGDYQFRELELTGVVGEDESDSDAIQRLSQFVSWHLNLPERIAEYNKQKKVLENEDADAKAKAHATLYIAKFEAAKAEVDG